MAGRVIKRPVQVDFVTGAGDAQRVGVVTAEGNQERTLSGRAWVEREKNIHLGFFGKSHNFVQKHENGNTFFLM